MPELSDLCPGPGQREIVFGGTRAGKSAYQEWVTRCIAKERPSAMQIIVDTKPRFRAETERSRFNPKDESRQRGGMNRGLRVPPYLIPCWPTYTIRILSGDCGMIPEKSSSYNLVRRMIGGEC